MSQKSDLPFGSEFSPSQVELPQLLVFADEHGGDWKAFEDAVFKRYFSKHDTTDYNRRKLANNTKLGMIAYGIIDREANLTEFGQFLLSLKDKPAALYAALGKQILVNLYGMNLVRCIRDMTAAGEQVNLTSLRDGLAVRGVHYPSGGKHPSMMRLWLAKAGVFSENGWRVNEEKLKEVLGADPNDVDVLEGFTAEQRAFLRALANTGNSEPQPANKIAELASSVYGIRFPEKSLPNLVLKALVEAGYITVEKTTEGRGAKPFLVAPTKKLVAELIEPLLQQLSKQTDPKLGALLRKPLSEILKELTDDDRHVRGLALEALAFKLMRLVDMDYVATRLRGAATGGAEVDLIFHSARLIYSRWQIQCKNTSAVALDDVAKEVGLTHVLRSNVIVIVSTGAIGGEARRYANKIMTESNLAIVMVDREDIVRIEATPAEIVAVFNREAAHAMSLKQFEI